MKRLLLLVLLLTLSCPICSANLLSSAAIQQAEKFVSLIDNHSLKKAHESTSDLLRLSEPEDEWIIERELTEKLLGTVLDRKLASVKVRDHYLGLPDGDYMIVYFEARTERKAKAAEVLLLVKDVDNWSVCSYMLK